MPTYDYECDDCGHSFEKFQSITAKPLRKCPECNGSVRRLIGTGAGVIFKGSGFYETDYKRRPASKKEPSPCSACKEAKSCPNAGGKGGGGTAES